MDFLKKYWAGVVLAVLLVLLFMVHVAKKEAKKQNELLEHFENLRRYYIEEAKAYSGDANKARFYPEGVRIWNLAEERKEEIEVTAHNEARFYLANNEKYDYDRGYVYKIIKSK